MTPAEEFERLREAWRELGRAVCRLAARRLGLLACRLVRQAERLEEIGYPQRWLDIGGVRIESFEMDGRQVPLPWPYRTEPITPDPDAPPSEHSRTTRPTVSRDHVHVDVVADTLRLEEQFEAARRRGEARARNARAELDDARKKIDETLAAEGRTVEQMRADVLAMIRDDDEEGKP